MLNQEKKIYIFQTCLRQQLQTKDSLVTKVLPHHLVLAIKLKEQYDLRMSDMYALNLS